MNIAKQISNEPLSEFKRVVHYAGLEDYPALFQPQNIASITAKLICEYLLPDSDYLIKRTVFTFKIDDTTKVNPQTGSLDPGGIGEKVFFDYLLENPTVLPTLIENYITELDNRGDFNEDNWYKREVKPYPYV